MTHTANVHGYTCHEKHSRVITHFNFRKYFWMSNKIIVTSKYSWYEKKNKSVWGGKNWSLRKCCCCCCCCQVASVVSDSVRPQRRQPTRLPRPWDSPGKNTGAGFQFLLQCMKWKVKVKSLSRVRLLGTPWTAAHQAPPPMLVRFKFS